MRDRAGSLVLPRYNSATPGTMVTSPNTSPSTNPTGSVKGGVALERGDSILLDIEGGEPDTGASGGPVSNNSQASWWRPDVIASPIKTAVFTHLGSAVSTGWSRACGTFSGTSITSYIRRVPALEKPFDLKEIHPGDPNDI